jgi:uncharacterized membrane protein HdeD (DUF308 family)
MQIAQHAFQSYRRLFLIRGIIGILFGVVVLSVSPAITLLVLVYLFGAYAFVGGIVAAALALRYTKEQGWALLLVEGILGILAGIVAFVWPGITAFAFLLTCTLPCIRRYVNSHSGFARSSTCAVSGN